MNIALFGSFVNGGIMTACFVAALLFARSYRDTRDRFFLLFSVSFLVLGLERIGIFISGGMFESIVGVYLMRCSAFLLIIFAVIDKNKR